jgi:large subunit ribosomal protein L4
MQKNGWNLFQFKPFAQRLQTLTQDVTRLAQADPVGYKQHPKTKLLASKLKAMNLQSVLVISEEVDDNLYFASRNLANVLVVEPRYADPVSLVHYKKVLVTKGAIDKLKEMFA